MSTRVLESAPQRAPAAAVSKMPDAARSSKGTLASHRIGQSARAVVERNAGPASSVFNDTDSLLIRARQLSETFCERQGMERIQTSQRLLEIHDTLGARAAEPGTHGSDGVLMRPNVIGESVPWTPEHPDSLSKIPIFSDSNVQAWRESAAEVPPPMQAAVTAPRKQLPSRVAATLQKAAANPDAPIKADTVNPVEVRGRGQEQMPTASEKAAGNELGVSRGSDISKGIRVLDKVKTGAINAAVARQRESAGQKATAIEEEGMPKTPIAAIGAIWYITGQRLYLVDRTGHVLDGAWFYELGAMTTLEPGTYFLSSFGYRRTDGRGESPEIQQVRVDEETPEVAPGEFTLRSFLQDDIPFAAQAKAMLENGVGIGIIVSPSAHRRHHEENIGVHIGDAGAGVARAVSDAIKHVPWAAREYWNHTSEHPLNFALDQLSSASSNFLIDLIPGLGQAMMAKDVLELLRPLMQIGVGGQSVDEHDLAAQSVARFAVQMVAGAGIQAASHGAVGLAKRAYKRVKHGPSIERLSAMGDPAAIERALAGADDAEILQFWIKNQDWAEGIKVIAPGLSPAAQMRMEGVRASLVASVKAEVLRQFPGHTSPPQGSSRFHGLGSDHDFSFRGPFSAAAAMLFETLFTEALSEKVGQKIPVDSWQRAMGITNYTSLERAGKATSGTTLGKASERVLARGEMHNHLELRDVLLEKDPSGASYHRFQEDRVAALRPLDPAGAEKLQIEVQSQIDAGHARDRELAADCAQWINKSKVSSTAKARKLARDVEKTHTPENLDALSRELRSSVENRKVRDLGRETFIHKRRKAAQQQMNSFEAHAREQAKKGLAPDSAHEEAMQKAQGDLLGAEPEAFQRPGIEFVVEGLQMGHEDKLKAGAVPEALPNAELRKRLSATEGSANHFRATLEEGRHLLARGIAPEVALGAAYKNFSRTVTGANWAGLQLLENDRLLGDFARLQRSTIGPEVGKRGVTMSSAEAQAIKAQVRNWGILKKGAGEEERVFAGRMIREMRKAEAHIRTQIDLQRQALARNPALAAKPGPTGEGEVNIQGAGKRGTPQFNRSEVRPGGPEVILAATPRPISKRHAAPLVLPSDPANARKASLLDALPTIVTGVSATRQISKPDKETLAQPLHGVEAEWSAIRSLNPVETASGAYSRLHSGGRFTIHAAGVPRTELEAFLKSLRDRGFINIKEKGGTVVATRP